MTSRSVSFLMAFCVALVFSNRSLSFGETLTNAQTVQGDPQSQKNGQQIGQNPSNLSGDLYLNNGKVGLGLSWMPANDAIYSGFVDIRYWVNRWFGMEGGVGLIHSSFPGGQNLQDAVQNTYQLTTFQVQGMIPIVERKHFVFYGDLDIVPEIGGPKFGYALLPGFGLEYALPEYPELSTYLQINPAPMGATVGNTPYTLISLPVSLGFHFYF